jgi:hypothetical protein
VTASARGVRGRLGLAAVLALACAGAAGQESLPAADRIADRANHQNPYFSAQGLKALKAQGDGAIPALERFIARRSLHALAPLVVEWLGEVPEDRARAILVTALANTAFPWRPQAARALARAPRPGELDLLGRLARDALPAVREPVLLALGDLGVRDAALRPRILAAIRPGLEDAVFEPRLAAAEALLRIGDLGCVPALVAALSVERRFFDVDFGVLARRRAWIALEPLVGTGVGYDASAGPARNADALAEIARRLEKVAETRPVRSRPAGGAPTAPDVTDATFGIEIRSCRAGDDWVRVTAGGELVLGHYDLERRRMGERHAATIAELLRGVTPAGAAVPRLDAGAFLGRPGCDFEKWYLPDETGLLRVTVGLEGRPEELEKLRLAVVAAIEETFGHERAQGFLDRGAPFGPGGDDRD